MEADWIEKIREEQPKLDTELIEKAYRYALNAHGDQKRESGEPYIVHPQRVAEILLELGMDPATVAAGLLHDVVEDTSASLEDLERDFGKEVAELVDGVTKIGKLEFDSREARQAESIRKMLFAMAKDTRVVLIRLADRLHNVMTLDYCPREKQIRVARETLEIFAPLAARLGIYAMKWRLEDYSFKAMDPEAYAEVDRLVASHHQQREVLVSQIIAVLESKMAENNIPCTISGRPKHLYSIYRKMHDQGKSFDQIFDLTAVRIVVNTEAECYTALGIVHNIWKPIPGRLKDYIALPKGNEYRSLHTTLIGESGIPFEVQIRTQEMHRMAEYGIAAHWKYKEKRSDTDSLDERLQWLRSVLEWQNETRDSQDFIDNLKVDLFTDVVFAFTPKGMVVELPLGANSLDFAYRIHSDVGNRCTGAIVNGVMQPLDVPLATGDIVKILTSNASKGPSYDWLKVAKTPQAQNKIRAWLKRERRDENIENGRAMFNAACKRAQVAPSALLRTEWLTPILEKMTMSTVDDMMNALGYGGISMGKIFPKLLDLYRAENKPPEEPTVSQNESTARPSARAGESGVIVKGMEGMLVRFARCCAPVPKDPIVGFISRGRGVSVHRADCPNMKNLSKDPARLIEVAWAGSGTVSYVADLHIKARDVPHLMVEVINVIQSMNAKMVAMNSRTIHEEVLISLSIEIHSAAHLENIIRQYQKIPDILSVGREGM